MRLRQAESPSILEFSFGKFYYGHTFLGVSTCFHFISGFDPTQKLAFICVWRTKNAPIYLFMAILSSIHTAVYRMNCMMSGSVTLKKTQNVGSTSPDKVEALVAFDFKRESAWKKHL